MLPPDDNVDLADDPLNAGGRPGAATNTHSCNDIRAVPMSLRSATNMAPRGLENFYQKYTEAYGIPILGSFPSSLAYRMNVTLFPLFFDGLYRT